MRATPRAIAARLSDQRGMTLIEMLTTMTIASFVFMAATSLSIFSVQATDRIEDSAQTAQKGRTALEQIVQRFNSQTCLFSGEYETGTGAGTIGNTPLPSIIYASSNKIVMIADIGGQRDDLGYLYVPELRFFWVQHDAATGRSSLWEGWREPRLDNGNQDTGKPFRFNDPFDSSAHVNGALDSVDKLRPERSRMLMDHIARPDAEGATGVSGATGLAASTLPVFRFFDSVGAELPWTDGDIANPDGFGDYAADDDKSIAPFVYGAASNGTLAAISRVAFAIKLMPEKSRNDKYSTTFINDFYVQDVGRCI